MRNAMALLPFAVGAITLALVCYTVGVWGERLQGALRGWHLAFFWVGFGFDTLGTTLMERMARGEFQPGFHAVTGLLAIVLMLVHAVWATAVLLGREEERKRSFHRLSIVVWAVWLIPFLSGMAMGMMR